MAFTYQEQQRELIDQLQSSFDNGGAPSQTVEMVIDYASDPRICLTVISFVSSELRAAITGVQDRLRRADPRQHYMVPEALHVTVRNVQVVADPPTFTREDVDRVIEAVKGVSARHAPIAFTAERIVRMPTSAFIFYTCGEAWTPLVADIRDGVRRAGIPDNKKLVSEDVFIGNTTFVRYTTQPTPEFFNVLNGIDLRSMPVFTLNDLHVVSANAVVDPAFSIDYAAFPLSAKMTTL